MKYIWEILVPTEMNGERIIHPFAHHKDWDREVRRIAGGLTIYPPGKGQWVSPNGFLYIERMIPVRIMATEEEINMIAQFTLYHYSQEAVMFYKVSDEVQIIRR